MPRREGETVTFMVLVGVGSRYETLRQSGLSHFLEHMFFKGTEKRPDKREIAESLDAVGAEFNAFTGEEVTAYYVKVAKEHLELGADVVSDILLRSIFPADEMEKEKGVIVEEIRMYTDNPMAHVQHLWNEAQFGGHPLGRRIDGSEKTVRAFKRQDLVRYVANHYHTRNAVVAVAGNFDEKKVGRMLDKLFADLVRGEETRPKAAPVKMPRQRFVAEQRRELDQTHMMVGVPGVDSRNKKRYAADLLSLILGGGMSSRLFMKVREEHGLAYSVKTASENYTDTGSFVTQAGLRSDKADFALKIIMEEMDKLMNEEVGEEELNKVKQMYRGRLVMGLEETNAVAVFAGIQQLLEKRLITPAQILEKVEAVSAEDVRGAAQELLDPSRRAVALLGPQKSTRAFEKQLV